MSALTNVRAVVIGAGFGGLSAAAHLSRAGASVTVVERAPHVGGKAQHVEKDGFVLDLGPTTLTLPDVMRDAFAAAGSDLDRVAPLTRLDPVARFCFASGAELVVSADAEATKRSIATFSPRDAARWDAFLAACKDVWEVAGEPYLEAPFEGLLTFTQRCLRRGSRALKLGTSVGALAPFARKHFESSEMHAYVGRFATYAGGSPYEASAAFAMIPHLETAVGVFYPRGGMHALANALADALRRRGVAFEMGSSARAITFDEGDRVSSVVTDRGRLSADVVVVNTDPLFALEHLLPARLAKAGGSAKLGAREHSLSGFAWSFGVEGDVPREAHNTVLFPRDYHAEFDAIFGRGEVPAEPTVFVSVPSLADPSRAPDGCHTVFTMINAPPAADADWATRAPRVRELVLRTLEERWCGSIGARIRQEAIATPRDIARSGAVSGAIYGAAPHGAMGTFERPDGRAAYAKGLYFAGGATHPGGGVPMVTLSGKFAAQMILADRHKTSRRHAAALSRFSS